MSKLQKFQSENSKFFRTPRLTPHFQHFFSTQNFIPTKTPIKTTSHRKHDLAITPTHFKLFAEKYQNYVKTQIEQLSTTALDLKEKNFLIRKRDMI